MQIVNFEVKKYLNKSSYENKLNNNKQVEFKDKISDEYDDLQYINTDVNNSSEENEINVKNRKRTKSDSSLNGRTSLKLQFTETEHADLKKKFSKSIIKNVKNNVFSKEAEFKKYKISVVHKNGTITNLIMSTNY